MQYNEESLPERDPWEWDADTVSATGAKGLRHRRARTGDSVPAVLDHVDTQRLLEAFATGALAGLLTESAPGRFQTEPPTGSVLKWVKTLGSRNREYTYVALRAGRRWYLTGSTSHGITFADLVEEIGDSPCDLATDWAKIPEPSPSENTSPAQWYLAMYPKETVDSDENREDM
jgi:hypothetical protein